MKVAIMLAALWLSTALAFQGGLQYTVRRGDTWTSVARQMGVSMCALARANGHRRCSSIYRASSRLIVGQTLEVPR